jgi:hypothetical protein
MMLALHSFMRLALIEVCEALLLVAVDVSIVTPWSFAPGFVFRDRSLVQSKCGFVFVDGSGMRPESLAVPLDGLLQFFDRRTHCSVLSLPQHDVAAPSSMFLLPVAVFRLHRHGGGMMLAQR